MSDLVLGLLVLGVALFVGVVVYNRWQERKAQRAFGSTQADALFEEETLPPARREPTLHKTVPLPDARVDYVVTVKLAQPGAIEGWSTLEHRFARRVMLAPGEDETTWHAALQLVSRAGVVGEAELIEFRSAVEDLAAKQGGAVTAPEMRAALDAARELDKTCADSDIQVALHVIGQGIEPPGDPHPFQVIRREDGVTLVLDVAVTPDLRRSYEAMARTGRQLAETHGARLVDDRGQPLDERALAAIGAQLEAVRQILSARGIETGSPLALRLFS
jgi:hypothetical protein